MNYSQIKKLDEDSQRDLQEGSGPVSECLCSLLSPPDDEPRGLKGSIKRAFASMGGRGRAAGGGGGGATKGTKRGGAAYISTGGPNTVDIPLTFVKGGKGIYTSKEGVKRTTSCGKCGCANEKIFLKHSYANIRITSPDVSSVCPCPGSACMPDKDKFNNNIRVTVERVEVSDVDTEDDETNAKDRAAARKTKPVKERLEGPSVKELMEHVWKDAEGHRRGTIEEYASEDSKILDTTPENYTKSAKKSESYRKMIEVKHEDDLKRPLSD